MALVEMETLVSPNLTSLDLTVQQLEHLNKL